MKPCNWKDLLTCDTATWDELSTALWEGHEDKMELVLVYQLDDGTEHEFGVPHNGDKLSLTWYAEDTPKAIRRTVEDFLDIVDMDALRESIETLKWQCVGDHFEGRFRYHVDLPHRPHALVFFRVYHVDHR